MNYHLIVIMCCCCLLSATATADDKVSEGLDLVLQDISMEAKFGDVVAAHPEAAYGDAVIHDIPVSAEQPGSLLITHDEDPFLGLRAFANVGFKDGVVYELVAVWTSETGEMADVCERFFTAAVQRHGHAYLRETMLVHPRTPEERPVAVFAWHEKDVVVLAFYTPASPLDPHPKSVLTYAQFTPGDPFLTDILETNPPTDEQRKEAWESMTSILSALEAVEQVK
jgi:hypothetical protein